MIRNIENTILNELQKNSVYLFGLPGIGKTHTALSVAQQSKRSYYYIDLSIDIEIRRSLDSNPQEAFEIIQSFLNGYVPYQGKSLLIIDGTEELTLAARKTLFEAFKGFQALFIGVLPLHFYQIDDHSIKSHSLSGFHFTEYLKLIGKENYAEMLSANRLYKKSIPDLFLDDIMEEYRNYLICGGFPTAIQTARLHNFDITYIAGEHRRLLAAILYKLCQLNEVIQFCSSVKIHQIIEHFFEFYSEHDKAFLLSSVRKGLSYADFQETFDYLKQCGLFRMIRINNGVRPEPMDVGITRSIMHDYNIIMDAEEIKNIPTYILQNYLYCALNEKYNDVNSFQYGRKSYFSIYDSKNSTAYLCCKSNHSLSVARAFYKDYPNWRIICLFPEGNVFKSEASTNIEDNADTKDDSNQEYKTGIHKMSYLDL